MSNLYEETVLEVTHYTDTLFSFRSTRDPAFRFLPGQFTMIGLVVDGKPLLRAYSMASAHYDGQLEFFSIKVPDGPLTSRLQHLKTGDSLLVGRKPVGTLVQDSLIPGRNLYLFSTGTGLAPFASIVRDPDAYNRFEYIVLVHGCRTVAELEYGEKLVRALPRDEHIGELAGPKLLYYPTTTREPFRNNGRITDLLKKGELACDLDLPPFGRADDRAMLCGSEAFLSDMVELLKNAGFAEGSASRPGTYVIEKAFVEK